MEYLGNIRTNGICWLLEKNRLKKPLDKWRTVLTVRGECKALQPTLPTSTDVLWTSTKVQKRGKYQLWWDCSAGKGTCHQACWTHVVERKLSPDNCSLPHTGTMPFSHAWIIRKSRRSDKYCGMQIMKFE